MNTGAFILFGKVFIFSHFCSFPFRKCIPLPSLSDIDILRDSVPDLKISIRSVTFDTFNWLRRNFVWPEEGGGGLATDWFFTAANFALQFFWGKFLRESVWRKLSNAEIRKCKEIYTSQVNHVLNRCFLVLSVRIRSGYQKSFDCQSHMSSDVFCAMIRYSFIKNVESWYPP